MPVASIVAKAALLVLHVPPDAVLVIAPVVPTQILDGPAIRDAVWPTSIGNVVECEGQLLPSV
jgi:hypothetical protein